MDTKIQTKAQNAIEACDLLAEFLDTHGLGSWSPRFRDISEALKIDDYNKAIRLEKEIPRGGMGSFGDFYVDAKSGEEEWEAQSKFIFLSGSQSKTITNLRVYFEYNKDNPLQNLDFNSLTKDDKRNELHKLR